MSKTFFRCALAVSALTLAPGPPGTAQCVSPPNETCSGAVVFSNADLPYEVTAPLGCINDVIDRPYFDVFYRFDCTLTATYLFDMCGSTGDTYLRVYGDGCAWVDGFELAVGDDECPGSPPQADPLLAVDLEAGKSYWLELGSWRPDPPFAPPPNAPYVLRVSVVGTPAAVPAGRVSTWLLSAVLLLACGCVALAARQTLRPMTHDSWGRVR